MGGEFQTPNPAPPDLDPSQRLESWKEIAAYLNRGVRTVIRWEQEEGLPVHRLLHDKRGSVYALKPELDAWRLGRESSAAADPSPARPSSPRTRVWAWVAAAAVVSAASAAAVFYWSIRATPLPPPRVTPLTRYPGTEAVPALSPDGKFVAFAWDGPDEDNRDIYVKVVGPGDPLRLTTHPARDDSPAWSPGGKQIAFVRPASPALWDVFVVSALGGAERRLASVSRRPSSASLRISWTPDGRSILAPCLSSTAQSALVLISADTGEIRPLSAPPPGYHDVSGVISPDGRTLAFLRSTTSNNWRVHVQPLDEGYRLSGEPRAFGSFRYSTLPPLWAADSQSVFYSGPGGTLWQVPVAHPGDARVVSGGWPAFWTDVSMARDGRAFVLADGWNDIDIWRFDLSGGSRPSRFLSSTAADTNPRYSPDGSRVAFASTRGGSWQIWVADASGARDRQLTSLDSPITGMPRWSPDGSLLAFDAVVGGQTAVWLVSPDGGQPRRLTHPPDLGFNPSWSLDGKSIYFCSRRSGREEIWKIPVSGRAPAVQITRTGGWNGFEADGGRSFYYAAANQNGPVLRLATSGGPPQTVIPVLNRHHNLAVTAQGIYYALTDESTRRESVWFYSFAAGQSKRLLDASRPGANGLDASPDGRFVLCSLVERRGGDLWLVEPSR